MDKIEEFIFSNELIALYKTCDVDWQTIHHYTSPDGLLGILREGGKPKLWFTRYDSLNDANERKDIISFLEKYCAEKEQEKVFSQEFCDAILSIRLPDEHLLTYAGKGPIITDLMGKVTSWTDGRTVECDTYLCCFSDAPDLLSMWNYYTKSQHYEGYSIGFSCMALRSDAGFEKGYSLEFKRVMYLDHEKTELFDKLLLPIYKLYADASMTDRERLLVIVQDFLNNFQFTFKNVAFQHEREIRAILKIPKKPSPDGMHFDVKYRNSNGYIVPYIEFEASADTVEEITVAPLLQAEISQRNLEELLKRRGYDGVVVKTSTVPIRF